MCDLGASFGIGIAKKKPPCMGFSPVENPTHARSFASYSPDKSGYGLHGYGLCRYGLHTDIA